MGKFGPNIPQVLIVYNVLALGKNRKKITIHFHYQNYQKLNKKELVEKYRIVY